jgi:hypothetical protein
LSFLYQNNKQNINERGFFVAGNNRSKTELILRVPRSGQQWVYVIPLLPAARSAAGNSGFMNRKTCFAGESYDLHARRLCSNLMLENHVTLHNVTCINGATLRTPPIHYYSTFRWCKKSTFVLMLSPTANWTRKYSFFLLLAHTQKDLLILLLTLVKLISTFVLTLSPTDNWSRKYPFFLLLAHT